MYNIIYDNNMHAYVCLAMHAVSCTLHEICMMAKYAFKWNSRAFQSELVMVLNLTYQLVIR
jgi:hypothetical protein